MNPDVQIFKDLPALSQAAAQLFIASAEQAIAERGRFLVALSGGSTPTALHRLLVDAPVDWPRVHVFWGDERCVPVNDPGNNYAQARDALLAHVPIPAENIHRIPAELEPASAARAYAAALSGFLHAPWPRLDLILLGMGDDGHTASLFPGSPVNEDQPVIAVMAHYQGRPAQRVSLAPQVINAARQIVFLVSGQSKSATLARVLKGNLNPMELPAQRIHPSDGKLIWMVDEAAGSNLELLETSS
jgi:6-phosphogluconolactonase